jgi:hypothetical protein
VTDAPQPTDPTRPARGFAADLRDAANLADAMSDFHGATQEELAALHMDASIADKPAQPMFLRLLTGERPNGTRS